MNFGITGNFGGYYLSEQYKKSVQAEKSEGASFANVVAAKANEQDNISEISFKDMWQARFPGAYYHSMDASNINQSLWERNDFPFEKFFSNELDKSILNWTPNGEEPTMDSDGVQSRLHSIIGQKSIVVPPELEEKMINNPQLAQHIMSKVENFIAANQMPNRICSHLIVLDKNGEIAHFRASSHGGNFTSSTEEEIRQFETEQTAKKKRRDEYARLNEENSIKRKIMEMEINKKHYENSIMKKAVSVAANENIMEMTETPNNVLGFNIDIFDEL